METRDPTAVIDAIVEHIPDQFMALRVKLARIRSNACFVAPECMQRIWIQIAEALQQCLHVPPKFEWEQRVHRIMKGQDTALAQPQPAGANLKSANIEEPSTKTETS